MLNFVLGAVLSFINFFPGYYQEFCFPPIAEYYNYWSGEEIPLETLDEGGWQVVERDMVINLWDPDERPTYLLYLVPLPEAEAMSLTVDGYTYSVTDLEQELDAGHFDEVD